jgi:hypothetical protein
VFVLWFNYRIKTWWKFIFLITALISEAKRKMTKFLSGKENFFSKIISQHSFPRDHFLVSKFDKFFVGKKRNDFKIMSVKDSEIIPEFFFCYYFYPIFFEKYNKNLDKNLVSKNNLWYLQKDLFLSNFKYEKSSYLKNGNKLNYKGMEPKSKNICVTEIDKKQASIKTILNSIKFKSGKNFKKNITFLEDLKKTKTFSDIDVSVKTVKNEEFYDFFDIFLEFREKKSLYVKPEINFDGFDFSSSLIFLNKIFFGKLVESKTKIDFTKEISKKKKSFLSCNSSWKIKNFVPQKVFFNFEKTKENSSSFKFGLVSKKKDVVRARDFNIISKKNWENIDVIDSFQISSKNSYKIFQNDKISLKTQLNVDSDNQIKKNCKFSLLIKNSLKEIFEEKTTQKFIIQNELFYGSPCFLTDYFSNNSFGRNFKKNVNKTREKRASFSKRTSFYLEKKYQETDTSFFLFSESFSDKKKEKQFTNLFFGIGMKIQHLLTFHIWLDKNGNKGFYVGI